MDFFAFYFQKKIDNFLTMWYYSIVGSIVELISIGSFYSEKKFDNIPFNFIVSCCSLYVTELQLR